MLRVMAVIVQKFKLKLNCAIKTHRWRLSRSDVGTGHIVDCTRHT